MLGDSISAKAVFVTLLVVCNVCLALLACILWSAQHFTDAECVMQDFGVSHMHFYDTWVSRSIGGGSPFQSCKIEFVCQFSDCLCGALYISYDCNYH